jgi:flavin-dependent dehydrogenase
MRKNSLDVVVLGGGPAGCAAAITLTRRGYAVAVVERSDYTAPRIGETLPPISRQLLAKLGVWDRFLCGAHLPSFGICSAWGRDGLYENDFIFDPYGHGWHIDRARFDEMLALAAEEAGANVFRGATLVSWKQDLSSEWEIEIAYRGGLRRCRTRSLIDASGRGTSFARIQGIRRIVVDRLIGVAAFMSPSQPTALDSRTMVEAVDQGWWYSARLPNSQLVIAYMTDSDLYAKGNRNQATYWQEQLQQARHTHARAKNYSVNTEPLIFAATSSRLDSPVGRNWLAVGDAALTVDPLSSQGVCKALESGLRAAEVLQDHWKGDETAMSSYAASVTQSFEHFLDERNQYYGREKRWPQSVFWRRRHIGALAQSNAQ